MIEYRLNIFYFEGKFYETQLCQHFFGEGFKTNGE
jgi:hypothetical protein